VLQWLFFEQYSHEPYVAVPRFWAHAGLLDENRDRLPEKLERGNAALRVMEGHLAGHAYFVGERYSIADIALYAYTHVAEEGGFELGPYAAIRAWCRRVREQPGHIPITEG
jgi:glutathione S-transferase